MSFPYVLFVAFVFLPFMFLPKLRTPIPFHHHTLDLPSLGVEIRVVLREGNRSFGVDVGLPMYIGVAAFRGM
jgi:hypothetical protein